MLGPRVVWDVPVHPVPSYTGLRLFAIIGHCLREDFSLTLVYYPGDLDIPPPRHLVIIP